MEIFRGIDATSQVNTILAAGFYNTIIQAYYRHGGRWPTLYVKVE